MVEIRWRWERDSLSRGGFRRRGGRRFRRSCSDGMQEDLLTAIFSGPGRVCWNLTAGVREIPSHPSLIKR